MENLVWRLQMFWYHIHGAKLWPVYTVALVVGVPLVIIFRTKLLYVFGRLLETSIYACILHVVLWFIISILNWLLEWTTDPLLPSGGRDEPIALNLFSFASKWYNPQGLMWLERSIIVVIGFVVFKYRYTYKKDSGG